jgi:hypothetical protein
MKLFSEDNGSWLTFPYLGDHQRVAIEFARRSGLSTNPGRVRGLKALAWLMFAFWNAFQAAGRLP